MTELIEKPQDSRFDADRALIREIAMDIGKSVIAHIEYGYPAMFEAVSPNARVSIRNHVHNEIMAALEVVDADEIRARLDARKAERRRTISQLRTLRRNSSDAVFTTTPGDDVM